MPFSVATVLSERIRPIPDVEDEEANDFFDSPTNLLAYEEDELERFYTLRIIYSHANCASPYSTVNVTTPYLSFDCGVHLSLNTTYVLPLRQYGLTTLSKCHTIVKLNDLTSLQKQFLSSRQLCCNGNCRCVTGSPAKCAAVPCLSTEPPCAEAKFCVNNYCDGCSADWFSEKNVVGCQPVV